MDFLELTHKARSCRRFDEAAGLPEGILDWLVECARVSPSGGNLQVLRYAIVSTKQGCDALFPCVKWAGYLTDWAGPEIGERPTGYVVLLEPGEKKGPYTDLDIGIVGQTIQLAATTQGIGCCMMAAFNPKDVIAALQLPAGITPRMVIALGKEKEVRVLEPLPADGSIKYWHDGQGVHHVPKRAFDSVVLFRK